MPTPNGEFNTEAKSAIRGDDRRWCSVSVQRTRGRYWQDLETRIVRSLESDQEAILEEAIRTAYNNMSQRAGRFTWINPSGRKGAPHDPRFAERPNGRFGVGAALGPRHDGKAVETATGSLTKLSAVCWMSTLTFT